MWSVIKGDERFIDGKATTQALTTLDWIYHNEQDGLLALANDFCQSPYFDGHQNVAEALKQIYKMCLRELPILRSTIVDVIDELSKFTR